MSAPRLLPRSIYYRLCGYNLRGLLAARCLRREFGAKSRPIGDDLLMRLFFRNLFRCPKRKVWVDPELGRKYCEFHKPTGSRILTPREIVTKMLADPRCDIKVALYYSRKLAVIEALQEGV
jgi:hypothetical protein